MLNGLEIKQIACSDSHCLAITGDGDVFSWGRNQNGQLGLGCTDACNMPQKVLAFQGIAVTMLPVGAEHTVAVTESGSLGCLPYLAYTING
jgi:alpha-tubulin suppressor-like RCC1 family protein